jgi:hypothetical protein
MKMISEPNAKQYCRDDISKIENYEQAINDKENKWVVHHRLEFTINGEFAHTWKELKKLGMYWKRPYFELIFMRANEHLQLHKKRKSLSPEARRKMIVSKKGKHRSEFGYKFKEHYGMTKTDNMNLYVKEQMWYLRHNKICRWEIENAV